MTAAGTTYQQPQQQSFFTWINPQDRPVYLRPWFLGLGASSILALTYALWKATEESRKPAPAPRTVPKTVAQ